MQFLRSCWPVLIAVYSLFNLALAQQYAGDNITNSLPAVAGSEIAYFKIKDATNRTATLINYYSLNSSGGRIKPSNAKRAVIIIHGLLRDPYLYIANLMQALAVVPDSTINKDNVAMIAPYFANGDDKGTGYPWTAGLKAGRGSTSNCLVWQGSQWASGADNQYPAYPNNITDISSYDVLDQIIQYFDNAVLFPNMQQIVIAGHSLGGQTVQRYVAVGNLLKTRTPVSYWSGNPDSLAWMSLQRNYDISSCPTYDDWRQGLSNYGNRYGASLVAQGRAATLARYTSRRMTYAHGTQDFGDDSTGCGPNTTGINRSERLFNFMNAFPLSCANPSPGGACATVDYVVAGHDAGAMMSSPAGQARLFTDNFNGDGKIAYDFGYPRAQKGDDPYPDPSLSVSSPVWTKQTYQGNLTYQGCWTKGNTSTLAYRAYQGNSTNTIEGCTSTCVGLGYSTTGMAWGYDCYCDNGIGYDAIKTADGACTMTCSGNSNQFCGGEEVLAVWSSGNLTQLKAPVAPTTVNNYTYLGCLVDSSSNPVLTGSVTTGVVSLESCATTCYNGGYAYFGTEYRNECHCGGSLPSNVTLASSTDCNLACTGNSTEICGGSLRISVYNTTIPVTTPATNLTCTNNASNGTIYQTPSNSSYQILCSFDSFGGDISGAPSASLATCLSTCDATSGCIGVGYTGGNCWLKSSLSSYYTNTNVVSAKKIIASSSTTVPTCNGGSGNGTVVTASNGGSYQVLCSMDSYAGDISGAASSSLSDCLNTCDNTSGCIDVSYTGGNCWLKSSITGFYANTGVISAQKVGTSSTPTLSCVNNASSNTTFTASNGGNYLIRCQTDRYGGDISGVQTSTFADCVNACDANSACLDVSYVTGYSPNCWLKSTLSTSYSNANVATAEKIVS